MPSRPSSPALAELRQQVASLEGEGGPPSAVLPFGIAALDRRLPRAGLALGCLHEVAGGGNGAVDGAAAACFAAGIVARLEDETGIANLVVWTKVFEAHRRIILSAGMIAVKGRVQREGEVVHFVAHTLTDLSRDLASIGQRDEAFPLPHGRGDEVTHGSPTPDPRAGRKPTPQPRDMYVRDLHLDTIKVKARDFR